MRIAALLTFCIFLSSSGLINCVSATTEATIMEPKSVSLLEITVILFEEMKKKYGDNISKVIEDFVEKVDVFHQDVFNQELFRK